MQAAKAVVGLHFATRFVLSPCLYDSPLALRPKCEGIRKPTWPPRMRSGFLPMTVVMSRDRLIPLSWLSLVWWALLAVQFGDDGYRFIT